LRGLIDNALQEEAQQIDILVHQENSIADDIVVIVVKYDDPGSL
jgi:hypothetical protein